MKSHYRKLIQENGYNNPLVFLMAGFEERGKQKDIDVYEYELGMTRNVEKRDLSPLELIAQGYKSK